MFKMHVFAAVALALSLVGFSRADDLADNAKARAAAAGKEYGMAWKRMEELKAITGPDIDGLYLWSHRWMEAEQEVSDKKEDKSAAAQAHLERMKKLEARVKELWATGASSTLDPEAAKFYRLEAERQVLLATPPPKRVP